MKYITFAPYRAGLVNVLLSYEVAFALSYITGRTLVLPPSTYFANGIVGDDYKNPDNFLDIWSILDKEYVTSKINCIDFDDVPELKEKKSEMGGIRHGFCEKESNEKFSHTAYIQDHIDDLHLVEWDDKMLLSSKQVVFTGQEFSTTDFNYFVNGRDVIDLSKIDNKFIHFEANLFGNYWYSVYPGDENHRNQMKNVVNKCIRYRKRFYELFLRAKMTLGKYNAVHIRRTDFLYARKDDMSSVSSPSQLKDNLLKFFDTNTTLYISTDEPNKAFFNDVLQEYQDVYFFHDFEEYSHLSKLEIAVMEQVICSQAQFFFGTFPSTYTKRINVMRGLENRQVDDDLGVNKFDFDNRENFLSALPWRWNESKSWTWEKSYHPQWLEEKRGRYLNKRNIKPPVYNKVPFIKGKLPGPLYQAILDEYKKMKFDEVVDDSSYNREYDVVETAGISQVGSSKPFHYKDNISIELINRIYKELTPLVTRWSRTPLKKAWAYGIRSYTPNSILHLHRDRCDTHVISCIIFVDQDSEVNWPLDFYDHEYKHHQVEFEAGDVLFYESLCVHGRATPFKGNYYRNMYFHWTPLDWVKEEYRDMKCAFKGDEEIQKLYTKSMIDLDEVVDDNSYVFATNSLVYKKQT